MATFKGDRLHSNPAFAALKAAALELTGLTYWSDKDDQLADLLAPVLERRSESPDMLLRQLDVEHGSGPASEAVVDAVTVGETSFFRFRAQFNALERVVIPAIMERNQPIRAVTAWSAGCSNGAEPYSLSLLVHRSFGALLTGWRVDILGTDVSAAALAEAQTGEYSAWTIRDLPEDMQRDCFARQGDRWRLRGLYRQGVRFLHHNLVNQPPPASGLDLVLCRNVLMYFDPDTRLRVLRQLGAALVPGGWLLLGHAEAGPLANELFEIVMLPDCTLYRRPVVP